MNAAELLRAQYGLAHRVLSLVMADVTGELAARAPVGTSDSIGTIYAHILADLDFMLHARALEQPLLLAAGWSERTGIPVPESPLMTAEWKGALRLNLAEAKAFAETLFATVDTALAENPAGRWERQVPGESGPSTALERFGLIALFHVGEHAGEIAALKGAAGLRGLPF